MTEAKKPHNFKEGDRVKFRDPQHEIVACQRGTIVFPTDEATVYVLWDKCRPHSSAHVPHELEHDVPTGGSIMFEYKTTHGVIEADITRESWRDVGVFNEYYIPDPYPPEGEGWDLVSSTVAALPHQNLMVWTWRRQTTGE